MDGEGFKLISRFTEQENVNLHILEKMVQSQYGLHNRGEECGDIHMDKSFCAHEIKKLLFCHKLFCYKILK